MSISKIIVKAVGKKYSYNQELMDVWFRKFYEARRNNLRKMYNESPLCRYCKMETIYDGENGSHNYTTLDHIIPISRGGGDKPSNYTLVCFRCNSLKGSRCKEKYLSLISNKARVEKILSRKISYIDSKFRKNIEDIDDNQKRRNLKVSFWLAFIMLDQSIKEIVKDIETEVDELLMKNSAKYHNEIEMLKKSYSFQELWEHQQTKSLET